MLKEMSSLESFILIIWRYKIHFVHLPHTCFTCN